MKRREFLKAVVGADGTPIGDDFARHSKVLVKLFGIKGESLIEYYCRILYRTVQVGAEQPTYIVCSRSQLEAYRKLIAKGELIDKRVKF